MSELDVLGRGPAFPFIRDAGGIWPMAEKDELVKMGIEQALRIGRGQRPMWKEKGSELARILFLPQSDSRAALIKEYATNAINQIEPRADVVDVLSNDSVDDDRVVQVEIQYSVIGSNVIDNLVLPFNKGDIV